MAAQIRLLESLLRNPNSQLIARWRLCRTLTPALQHMCQAREKDRFSTTAAQSECNCESEEAYKECQSTVSELQSQVSSFNGSVTRLTQQVSRCSAIHQEVFFHQYIRSLLQQLPKLAAPPVSIYLKYILLLLLLLLLL